MKSENTVEMHYSNIFPWLVNYRCGNCFNNFGDNLELVEDQEIICSECRFVNIYKSNPSKVGLALNDYEKIIGKIEKEAEYYRNAIERDNEKIRKLKSDLVVVKKEYEHERSKKNTNNIKTT